MYEFSYVRPGSVSEAVGLLAGDPDAKLIAGGQTLLPTMKQRLAAPSILVDLGGIPELRGIGRDGGDLVIGAMTSHADVAASPVVRAAIPGLAELAELIGDPHVRHRGTIGGSVANNDPAADYPAACLALDARIVTDRREIGADAFFTGLFATALEEGEIVTRIAFPLPRRMGYAKFRNPASRYAMAGVCVALAGAGPRAAVTGSGADGVFRWTEAEARLTPFRAGALQGLELAPDTLFSDMHGQADYRAHLVAVMAERALAAALARQETKVGHA